MTDSSVSHSSANTPRLLIAASGTGGHVFPAIAVASCLQNWDIQWLGVPDRLEVQLVKGRYPLHTVAMSGLQGGIKGRLAALWRLGGAFWQVRQQLKRGGYVGVFTTGGYIAAPAILAARSLGLPVVIHESNAIPGKVTRWLAPWCTYVAIGLDDAMRALPNAKTKLVGNPVRSGFLTPQPFPLEIPTDAPLILVTGGSQGARGLNRLVVEAAPAWIERGAWIVHLTGEQDAEAIAELAPQSPQYLHFPFRPDIDALLQRATFSVCRSGAMTLAELEATQTPAILVPYPYAAEDHQYANAIAFAKGGGAIVCREGDLTAATLTQLGNEWLDAGDRLVNARNSLKQGMAANASNATADLIRSVMES